MALRILNTIGNQYPAEARTVLKTLGSIDYATPTQVELVQTIGDYDAAVIGLGLKFDKSVIEVGRKLRYIATATTGLDHIDTALAAERGITVVSLKGENAFLDTVTGTAELAFALILDLMRFMPCAFDSVKRYEWEREKFRGYNLFGKTLGVVGLGRLGKMAARYGKAFGMRVLFADPNVEHGTVPDCEKCDFDTLLKDSDIISIHVHLSPETENLFNREVFERMKKGALLINTSRGKIVNEADVLDVLKSGHLRGYGTDVLTDENDFPTKGFKDHPLVEYAKQNRNVIIVPHIGGMTHESRVATDLFIAEKLRRALLGK